MNRTNNRGERFGHSVLKNPRAALLVVLALLLLVFEGRILLVLFAGILFALALRATSATLARWTHVPYGAVLAFVALLVVGSLVVGLYFLGAGVVREGEAFLQALPDAWRSVLDSIHRRPALAQAVAPLEHQGAAVGDPLSRIATSASAVVEVFGGIIIAFFVGLYGAAQPDSYLRIALALVRPRHRARARLIAAEMRKELTRWLAARAVAMIVVGVLVTIGLLLLKIPLALVLGVLAGALAFIEYLGAWVSAVPAMLLAFTRAPIYAVWVGLIFLGAHIIEGYVMTPLLVRTTVRFPPGYTLAAQVILGAIFGVLGLTLATPVTIVATVLVRSLYLADELPIALSHPPHARSA